MKGVPELVTTHHVRRTRRTPPGTTALVLLQIEGIACSTYAGRDGARSCPGYFVAGVQRRMNEEKISAVRT
jgi:hypothetical protein